MPWPSVFSEQSLRETMLLALGAVGQDLDLDAADLEYACNDALAACSVTDPATLTAAADVTKLRLVAVYYAWKWAVEQYIPQYTLSLDGQSLQRGQKVEAAAKHGLAMAAQAASHYGVGGGTVRVRPVVRSHDPYAPLSDVPVAYP